MFFRRQAIPRLLCCGTVKAFRFVNPKRERRLFIAVVGKSFPLGILNSNFLEAVVRGDGMHIVQ